MLYLFLGRPGHASYDYAGSLIVLLQVIALPKKENNKSKSKKREVGGRRRKRKWVKLSDSGRARILKSRVSEIKGKIQKTIWRQK